MTTKWLVLHLYQDREYQGQELVPTFEPLTRIAGFSQKDYWNLQAASGKTIGVKYGKLRAPEVHLMQIIFDHE